MYKAFIATVLILAISLTTNAKGTGEKKSITSETGLQNPEAVNLDFLQSQSAEFTSIVSTAIAQAVQNKLLGKKESKVKDCCQASKKCKPEKGK